MDALPERIDASANSFTPIEPGEEFGAPGGAFQYRLFRVLVPDSSAGAERHLVWDCDGEATVYLEGEPWAGLDVAHRYCVIPSGDLELIITVGTYQQGVWVDGARLEPNTRCRYRSSHTATRDEQLWSIYWDMEILRQLAEHHLKKLSLHAAPGEGYHPPLERAPVVVRKLLARLDEICDALELEDYPLASELLARAYGELRGTTADGRAELVGHSHLDLVWLWPERITYEKAVHTTASTLRLMERYPEMTYVMSTPLLYDHLRKYAPGLWRQIESRMQEGRWEIVGAMYVESDVNLPSGEGLARSLLYGQQAFEAVTGRQSSVLWLPDVFGYPACLPQILRQCGVSGFFTTKLSWSTVTRFPYSACTWRSPDGSSVMARLSPVGYNEPVTVATLNRCFEEHRQTGIFDSVLVPVGQSDGGGGVTEEMVESARRMRSLVGLPEVSWTRVEDHYQRLCDTAASLPEYEGELYLEYHRGTLTTQGRFKDAYRSCERAMQLREAVRAVAGLGPLCISDWRRVLLAQFHDALPGSSINEVYRELEPELVELARSTREHARAELESAIAPAEDGASSPAETLLFNPVALPRTIVVDHPAGASGEPGVAHCDGIGLFAIESGNAERDTFPEVSDCVLDNGILRAEFDDGGMLSALAVRGEQLEIHKTAFMIAPDLPHSYDAWEIDYPAGDLARPAAEPMSLVVTEKNGVRAALQGSMALGEASTLTVRYILTTGSDHLFIELDIDWAEEHRLLQYAVWTGYRGHEAVYGEPFGSVRRRQVPGLASDIAKWEAPGQRWAAVCSDAFRHGVALISEAKYGFSCKDGELRMSLLRATSEPDPDADRGSHHIRFAIGRYRMTTDGDRLSTPSATEALFADTVLINGSTRADSPFPSGVAPVSGSVIRLREGGSLTPSWVKPPEDGEGLVVRLHECAGEGGSATLQVHRDLFAASRLEVCLTNILEDDPQASRLNETGCEAEFLCYEIPYRPYQIVTVMMRVLASKGA